jgi:hypothetical protein
MTKTETSDFSPRSKASVIREEQLLAQIARVETQLSFTARKISEEERTKQITLRQLAQGRRDGWTNITLDNATRDLADLTRRKASLEQFKAELTRTLEAERAIPADRARIQAQLAALAAERHERDAAIEEAIGQLRGVLEVRGKLSARMSELADKIEFSGDLDQERFDRLAASLPSILGESKQRLEALLGVPGTARGVARVRLELSESLRSLGIVLPGHELLLTQQEFDALSRADAPEANRAAPGTIVNAGSGREAWRLRPQQVCSVEQFEADKAEAERRGCSVEQVWRAQDEERNAAAAQRYAENEEAAAEERRAVELSERFAPPMPLAAAREVVAMYPGLPANQIVYRYRAACERAIDNARLAQSA